MPDDQEIIDSPREFVADHIRRYVASGGVDGHIRNGVPSLLLTTTGRVSGKLHRTALYYGRDRGRYIVVASTGGGETDPQWYKNLVVEPRVDVQVMDQVFEALAWTATAEEKARLWPIMTEIFPMYNTYQQKTSRDIPVVILERV